MRDQTDNQPTGRPGDPSGDQTMLYKCSKCGMKYESCKSLEDHNYSMCRNCDECFQSRPEILAKHKPEYSEPPVSLGMPRRKGDQNRSKEREAVKLSTFCYRCKRIFQTEEDVKKHTVFSSCNICQKCFSGPKELECHKNRCSQPSVSSGSKKIFDEFLDNLGPRLRKIYVQERANSKALPSHAWHGATLQEYNQQHVMYTYRSKMQNNALIYECSTCEHCFTTPSKLQKHENWHHRGQFQNPNCETITPTINEYIRPSYHGPNGMEMPVSDGEGDSLLHCGGENDRECKDENDIENSDENTTENCGENYIEVDEKVRDNKNNEDEVDSMLQLPDTVLKLIEKSQLLKRKKMAPKIAIGMARYSNFEYGNKKRYDITDGEHPNFLTQRSDKSIEITNEMQPWVVLTDFRKCLNTSDPDLERFLLQEREREMAEEYGSSTNKESFPLTNHASQELDVVTCVKQKPEDFKIQKDLNRVDTLEFDFSVYVKQEPGEFIIEATSKQKPSELDIQNDLKQEANDLYRQGLVEEEVQQFDIQGDLQQRPMESNFQDMCDNQRVIKQEVPEPNLQSDPVEQPLESHMQASLKQEPHGFDSQEVQEQFQTGVKEEPFGCGIQCSLDQGSHTGSKGADIQQYSIQEPQEVSIVPRIRSNLIQEGDEFENQEDFNREPEDSNMQGELSNSNTINDSTPTTNVIPTRMCSCVPNTSKSFINPFRHWCETCESGFESEEMLSNHMPLHTEGAQCTICSISFPMMGTLIRHMKTHTSYKPFQCITCSGYKEVYQTPTHPVISTSHKRDYKLNSSEHGRGLPSTHTLAQDMRESHINPSPYSCIPCSTRYAYKKTLFKHMQLHTVNDELCAVCCRRFPNKKALRRHMEQHTSYKPYKCGKCTGNKSLFMRESALQEHLEKHDNVNQFKCEKCEMDFKNARGLKMHVTWTHDRKPPQDYAMDQT